MGTADTPDVPRRVGLLEREDALATLDSAWKQVSDGGFVLVCGPAGVGKTSLLAEFRGRLQERGAPVLSAIGSEFEQGFAFELARQLLERPLRELADAARDRVLAGPAGAARQVLGFPGGTASSPVGDPAFAAIHALHWAVGNLAADQPLVLLVDDAQWADPETAAWLAYTARRTGDLPVLFVVAMRDDEPTTSSGPLADLLTAATVERLTLEVLSEDAIGDLLAAALGRSDAALTAACSTATGGNAFLVTELVRQITREGTPPTAAAVAQLGPPAIARAAVTRMARLSPAAADVGQWLAVLGSATTAELSALTDLGPGSLQTAVDDLVGAGILASARPLAFRHPVVRASIMRELAPMKRAAAHLAAARVLNDSGRATEDIAAQLLQTEPTGEPWVAGVLIQAAAAAAARAAPASALALLDRALAEPPAAELLASAERDAAAAALVLGRPDAAARLARALELRSDPVERGGLARTLAATLLLDGDAPGALTVLEDAATALPREARDLGLALELDIWRVGQFDPAARQTTLSRAARFTPAPGDQAQPGFEARDAIEAVLTDGTAPNAARRARLALAGGGLLATEGSESPIFQMAANALLLAGDLEGARAVYDEAIAQASAGGSRRGFVLCHAFRALAHRGLGNLPDAAADAGIYLEHGVHAGPVFRVALAVLVTTQLDAGDRAAAGETLREHAPQPGAEASAGHLLQARARLALETGQHEEALAQLATLEQHEAIWGIDTPAMTQWRLYAARAHAALGRADRARELASQELERARIFDSAAIAGSALSSSAAVAAATDRLPLLEEAVTVLADSHAALEHARALVALGAELRRLGRRVDARPPLNAGVELARRCGSLSLVDLGYEELAAAGSRQRRILRAGAEALTPSERRIARLAANGASNREIAQALFLSVRTVETHLTHIYRKLDISSRRELASAIVECQ